MPVVLSALTEAQKLLKENRDAVEALGAAAKITATLLGVPFKGALIGLNALLQTHRGEIALIVALYKQWSELAQIVSKGGVPQVDPNAIPAQSTLEGAVDGLKLLQQVQEGYLKSLKPFNLREILGLDKGGSAASVAAAADPAIALLQQLQSELRSMTERTREQEIGLQLLDDQFKNVNATVRQYLVDAAKSIDLKKAEIEAAKKHAEEIEKEKRKILELKGSLSDFEFRQTQALRQIRFGDKTAVQEASEFVRLLEHAGLAVDSLTKFWLNFNAQIIDSVERVQRMLELMRESQGLVPAPGGPVPEGQPVPVDLGPPPEISIWQEAMGALQDQMVGFSDFIHTTFIQSVSDISAALGQGIAAWALYGGSFAKAMKQALAALGAKIAAEAIMQAAIHGAYAIGSAAFGNWAAAAKHALAAAKFAAIGGIAALATRALAGNDFKQGGGNAFEGGSSAGAGRNNASGGTTQRGQPTPVDLNRDSFVRVPPVINITISGEAAAAFDYKVERAVVQNINLNGEIRSMIKKEAA
jgi:O6-methylguanine-DNA--protein-cysteine methyltransferase